MIENDELRQLLIEIYKVTTEESRMVGTQKIQVFTSNILCMAVLLSFIGLALTQYEKIIDSNLVIIGLFIVGFILFYFFFPSLDII